MIDFDLGLLVKEHRNQAGLKQLELANLAGVGKTTVFDIEKNKETVR
jgi:DNA-binding XRE family transcriptional regulator